jgi:arylsulfatase A-like enzyme
VYAVASVFLLLPLLGCERDRPNLLFIAVDTLRADHLGGYGYGQPTSPMIDQFLNEAVVFEDMQSSASWTLPSFASMMTSLYPSTHRLWNFNSRLDGSYTTLAEVLKSRGFATAAIVSHTFLNADHGLVQGFDHHDDSVLAGREEVRWIRSSAKVSRKAVAWLRARAALENSAPWYLFVHYFDPHVPYLSHPKYANKFDDTPTGRYDAEIAFTDANVGRLFDTLRELELDHDTIVAFTSDHGEEFDDHGGRWHGRTLYQEVLRIPFAIRAAGFEPGRVSQVAESVDVFPTLLELLGENPADIPMEGQSLVPSMRGSVQDERGMLAEIELYPDQVWKSYRRGPWKLVVKFDEETASETRLYDLSEDPGEQTNLVSAHPDVAARLEKEMTLEVQEATARGESFDRSEDLELDERERAQLRALGYVE